MIALSNLLENKKTSGENIATVIKPVGWSTEVVPNHGGAVKLYQRVPIPKYGKKILVFFMHVNIKVQ